MKKHIELKEAQKQLALIIKTLKQEIKETQRSGKYAGILQVQLLGFSRRYRLDHIAYSLLKGRTYEQIETPKECHKLSENDWQEIEKIKNAYTEQDVCVSA